MSSTVLAALFKEQCSIILNNFWECQDSNPGLLAEKLKCYLCAISAAAPFFISFLSLKIIQNFKNVVVLFPAQPHPLGFRRKRKLLRFAAKAKIMKILIQALNFKDNSSNIVL